MSDDFIKQLQENAVDKVFYESQQQELNNESEIIARRSLYNTIIEVTKCTCIKAVKKGDFLPDNSGKKINGTLTFFCCRDTEAYDYYYETSIGVSVAIGDNNFSIFPLQDKYLRKWISEECILFIIPKRREIDVSSFIDKLRNKNNVTTLLSYEDDVKEIQTFIDMFQERISNSKILEVSKISHFDFKNCKSRLKRVFKFEVIF